MLQSRISQAFLCRLFSRKICFEAALESTLHFVAKNLIHWSENKRDEFCSDCKNQSLKSSTCCAYKQYTCTWLHSPKKETPHLNTSQNFEYGGVTFFFSLWPFQNLQMKRRGVAFLTSVWFYTTAFFMHGIKPFKSLPTWKPARAYFQFPKTPFHLVVMQVFSCQVNKFWYQLS